MLRAPSLSDVPILLLNQPDSLSAYFCKIFQSDQNILYHSSHHLLPSAAECICLSLLLYEYSSFLTQLHRLSEKCFVLFIRSLGRFATLKVAASWSMALFCSYVSSLVPGYLLVSLMFAWDILPESINVFFRRRWTTVD